MASVAIIYAEGDGLYYDLELECLSTAACIQRWGFWKLTGLWDVVAECGVKRWSLIGIGESLGHDLEPLSGFSLFSLLHACLKLSSNSHPLSCGHQQRESD